MQMAGEASWKRFIDRPRPAMRVLTCSTVCVAALLVLYPIVGHTQLDTAFQGSDTLPARRAALDVEEEYLAPSNPLPAAQRGVCSGLGQLETLKGDWVDHEDAQYRGFNPNATCPSFLHDYECLADYIDEKYSERQAQEYRKVFRPHACDLQEFSAEQFQACLRGRRIIMIGDSTMRQLFQSLACLFTAHIRSGDFVDWNEATPAQTSIPFERPYTLSDEPDTTIFKQNLGNFTLKNGAEVHIRSFGIFNLSLWDDVMAELAPFSDRDTLIVEFGAWYARFNFNGRHVHKPWVRYQRDMYELFTKRLAVHPSPVLWRSYGPSHFGGMTGTYTAMNDHLPHLPAQETCEPASHGEYYYDTWVHRHLVQCGARCANIHMLPVYHLSLAMHDSHHGSFGRGVEDKHIDCRHYCSNVIDTWSQVLFHKICLGQAPQRKAGRAALTR